MRLDSMELRLNGSQINLATRDKATAAPAVNYPVFVKRPGSASVTLTTPSARLAANNRLAKAHSLQCLQYQPQQQPTPHKQHKLNGKHKQQRGRPVSADFERYRIRSATSLDERITDFRKSRPISSSSSSASSKKQLCSSRTNANPLSSSNIYKRLLAEPIKKSGAWMTSNSNTLNESKDAIKANDMPTSPLINESPPLEKDGSDGSSYEDEIQEEVLSGGGEDDDETDYHEDDNRKATGVDDSATKARLRQSAFAETKSNSNQTVKTTVIEAKTSSSPTSNRLKLSKFSVEKASPKRAGSANKSEKRIGSNSASATASSSSSSTTTTTTSKFITADKKTASATSTSSTSAANANASGGFNLLKTDLPGRVSFSKNDVYEIDYSDFENDTDTSRSLDQLEPFRKKNVHFEDEYFNEFADKFAKSDKQKETHHEQGRSSAPHNSNDDSSEFNEKKMPNESELSILKEEKFCCSLKCNSLRCKSENPSNRLEVLREDSENGKSVNDLPVDSSEKIIEEYKREIENINRQHELELKWSGNKVNNARSPPFDDYLKNVKSLLDMPSQLNDETSTNAVATSSAETTKRRDSNDSDSWSSSPNHATNLTAKSKATNASNTSDESQTRDSTSTVINNYLKVTNQQKSPNAPGGSTTIKFKTTKKLTPSSQTGSDSSGTQRKIKSATNGKSGHSVNRVTKARSIGNLQSVTDVKLNEFQIDKVESWMSTHEDTFSDVGALNSYRKLGKFGSSSNLEYKKAWRETPTSKTDDEGNFSLDDQVENASIDGSTHGEIELVLKKLQGRRMKISFDPIKNSSSVPTLSIASSGSHPTQNLSISSQSTDHTPDKIKEIYQYLDEVDFNCDRTINSIKLQKIPEFGNDMNVECNLNIDGDVVGDVPKLADLLLLSSEQLARRVISLYLRVNELSNAIQLSKEHMEKLRNENQKVVRNEKQASQARLKEQKTQYESIVARHQGFIEQLLKDKASLCEKVSALTRRLESQHQAAEHKFETEIARVKETALAAEKIRRERWIRENTKKIKELTVKGLEQEISKMACNHQKEINELKRQHQQEILDAVEEARQKHESLEMNIRENYAHDRESAIEKERNAIRERFERQMEVEQKAFEEHKSRLMAEFAAEKERQQCEQRQKEHHFDTQREKLLHEKKELAEHLNREYNDKIRMIEKRNQSEIASIREQFESDFAIWKREQETAYKLREVENANAIRQQCRLERDKQIDSIVAKVDAETLKIQQDFEIKISRLKSQYESELRDMERGERQTREKYVESRSKLAECEANIQNLHATVKQLEIQLSHSQKMCDNFATEKEHFKENARKDIQQEIDAMRKERADEIQQIHKRVQQAIEKKDASLDVLQKENAVLKERCMKLELVIRQQRKDYCTK